MALHFHPEFANLLAVGCYDGSVAVFDVRDKSGKPLYQANVKTGKHSDPVWQVSWQVSGRALHSSCFRLVDQNNMDWMSGQKDLVHSCICLQLHYLMMHGIQQCRLLAQSKGMCWRRRWLQAQSMADLMFHLVLTPSCTCTCRWTSCSAHCSS